MPEETIKTHSHIKRRLSPARIIIFGYLGMIVAGAALLMLPFATRTGESAGVMTALFTSTSASCVTGLVLQDTYSFWSGFGQAVILVLIQVGGLGIITMTMLVGLVAGRKISLKQRVLMRDSISAPYMGGIVRLTRFALITTGLFELTGAAALCFVFIPKYGVRGIWMAVFHSVSAFCNAGFDLMGVEQEFSSITLLARSPVCNITLMLLIVIGGLGFFVWEDIKQHGIRFKRYSLHTKSVLVASALLILLPAVYFYIVNQSAFSGSAAMKALFQSVTTRTAGFNTVDFGSMTEGSQLISIVLMMIGGSPGSTAGGIKTTTVLVLIACIAAVFRRRGAVQLFGRALHSEIIRKAVAILSLYLLLFLTSSALISELEGIPILTSMFESASAVGTVGLTLGITPTTCTATRIILMALMYFGRVGCLTLLLVFNDSQPVAPSRLPHEDITVG